MKVNIETIPHEKQRYNTVGDWWFEPDGTLQIRVSEMKYLDHEHFIAVHEYVEALLCKHSGVSEESVTKFDMDYEKRRTNFDTDEPGDSIWAPYRREHCFATAVERMLCAAMNHSWEFYELRVNSLSQAQSSPRPESPT